MSDDLVMDLRKGTMFDSDSALMWDAADEIERLRAALRSIEENEHQFSMGWAARTARAALPKGENDDTD